MVLLEMFFAMFVIVGFVVPSVSYATHVYAPERAGLIAGIGAGSYGAIVALTMPVFGRLFDMRRYDIAFRDCGATAGGGICGLGLDQSRGATRAVSIARTTSRLEARLEKTGRAQRAAIWGARCAMETCARTITSRAPRTKPIGGGQKLGVMPGRVKVEPSIERLGRLLLHNSMLLARRAIFGRQLARGETGGREAGDQSDARSGANGGVAHRFIHFEHGDPHHR